MPVYRLNGTLPLVTPSAHKHEPPFMAAGRIVRRPGSSSLTLDARAATAGVGKGG